MRRILFITLLAFFVSSDALASPYASTLARLGVHDAVVRAEVEAGSMSVDDARAHVRENIEDLFDAWEGTPWGLGRPQTETPQRGKINCGTFVGTVLRDAGFRVNHRKLQRQPAELIVKSFAARDDIRRFRNAPMSSFLDDVQAMGPGIYIIGLDYHVGFLVVEDARPVRFVHAGLYPMRVVDELAEGAREITESRYRIVGKVLADDSIKKWIGRQRIAVRGNW